MKVPKIIHQIWIGDKAMPINAMNTVKNMNPDYEYMFWCEKTIEEKLKIHPRYQRKIDEHTAIWGKADMLRYLILEQYGGIYVDADMLCIEGFDDFLLNKGFSCYENEIERPNLINTCFMGFPKNHIVPQTAIKWIMDNNVNIEQTKTASWILVAGGLLSRVYYDMIPDKSVMNIYPSYLSQPDHHSGCKYMGHGKVYTIHGWGSTKNTYNEINVMKIPKHHTLPEKSIDIIIPDDDKLIKEVMKGLKDLEGHFTLNIKCKKDITKYLKSMRNVKYNV